MEPINSTKKCTGPMNSSKKKLNSEISWLFNLESNAHLDYIQVCFKIFPKFNYVGTKTI